MRYVIRDFTMDIPCAVDDLSPMWERGQKMYGPLPRTGSQRRIMRPSIAQKPCYLSDPVVATWEDVNLAEVDSSGMLTMTGARDPRQPRGPRVTQADHDGQLACCHGNAFLLWYSERWRFAMEVAIYLPDDVAAAMPWEDVPRHILEQLALEGYQERWLSEEQVRRLLGFDVPMEVHGFLKDHGVPLDYTVEDLEQDREAHRHLGL